MRLLLICGLLFSGMAYSQVRVKENIKQKSVAVSDDGSSVQKSAPKKNAPAAAKKPGKK